MAEMFRNPKVWISPVAVAQLIRVQEGFNGVTPILRTCVAAYKQHTDIAYLLTLLAEAKLDKEAKAKVAQITKRHNAYTEQQSGEAV